jgi:Galactose oxidase, central domain
MAIDEVNRDVVVVGGVTKSRREKRPSWVHRFPLAAAVSSKAGWKEPFPNSGSFPPARIGASLVAFNQSLVLFGGCGAPSATTDEFQDLWSIDLVDSVSAQWASPGVVGTPPSPRCYHLTAVDETEGDMYIWGGSTDVELYTGSLVSDLHRYSLSTNEWLAFSPAGAPPIARIHATAVTTQARQLSRGGGSPTTAQARCARLHAARRTGAPFSTRTSRRDGTRRRRLARPHRGRAGLRRRGPVGWHRHGTIEREEPPAVLANYDAFSFIRSARGGASHLHV